ncbi:MAG: 2Fe-2S iron-sulfur cluster-binding protein [Anaerolineales bacterium]
MSTSKWDVTFLVYRKKGQGTPHYDEFTIKVNPDEYVLDAIERIWAYQDRSLVFAHACHHSTCGACGMRVNGVEKLTCITLIREVTADGGTVKVDPLRNFPIISDLAIDMGVLYTRMDEVGHRPVLPLSEEPVEPGVKSVKIAAEGDIIRLADCIECGLCISACPIANTTSGYLGPAVLAGALQHGLDSDQHLFSLVEGENGVWRCHSAFECTEVCPSYVEPAGKIMELRKQVIWKRIFGIAK